MKSKHKFINRKKPDKSGFEASETNAHVTLRIPISTEHG